MEGKLNHESQNTIKAIGNLGEVLKGNKNLLNTQANQRFEEIEASINVFSEEIISQVELLNNIKDSTNVLNNGIQGYLHLAKN